MRLNGLESLYGLDMRRSEEMTAKDIMETDLKVVPCQTTVSKMKLSSDRPLLQHIFCSVRLFGR